MRQRKSSGFTLLELLIVVIIVGVLATIAMPQFSKMTKRFRTAEADNTIGAILTAQLVYYQENAAFADDITKLLVNPPIGARAFFTYTAATTAGQGTGTATGKTGTVVAGVVVSGQVNADGTREELTHTGL